MDCAGSLGTMPWRPVSVILPLMLTGKSWRGNQPNLCECSVVKTMSEDFSQLLINDSEVWAYIPIQQNHSFNLIPGI